MSLVASWACQLLEYDEPPPVRVERGILTYSPIWPADCAPPCRYRHSRRAETVFPLQAFVSPPPHLERALHSSLRAPPRSGETAMSVALVVDKMAARVRLAGGPADRARLAEKAKEYVRRISVRMSQGLGEVTPPVPVPAPAQVPARHNARVLANSPLAQSKIHGRQDLRLGRASAVGGGGA